MATVYRKSIQKREPNINDIFNKNLYEYEPNVFEIEVKESFRYISNRKALGCDGIPIEFLKSGGDEAIRVMTSQCNSIWKTKIWPNDRKKSIYVSIYKKSDKKNVETTEHSPNIT